MGNESSTVMAIKKSSNYALTGVVLFPTYKYFKTKVRLQSQLLLVDEGLIGGSGVGGQSSPSQHPRALSGRCMLSDAPNEARASAWVEAALHVS